MKDLTMQKGHDWCRLDWFTGHNYTAATAAIYCTGRNSDTEGSSMHRHIHIVGSMGSTHGDSCTMEGG